MRRLRRLDGLFGQGQGDALSLQDLENVLDHSFVVLLHDNVLRLLLQSVEVIKVLLQFKGQQRFQLLGRSRFTGLYCS